MMVFVKCVGLCVRVFEDVELEIYGFGRKSGTLFVAGI